MKITRTVTRKDINKENMVALGRDQCKEVLKMFWYYRAGYNAGFYGWNYDLYNINGVSIVAGSRVPYKKYSNEALKKKLVALNDKIRIQSQSLSSAEYAEAKENWEEEFLRIFE